MGKRIMKNGIFEESQSKIPQNYVLIIREMGVYYGETCQLPH